MQYLTHCVIREIIGRFSDGGCTLELSMMAPFLKIFCATIFFNQLSVVTYTLKYEFVVAEGERGSFSLKKLCKHNAYIYGDVVERLTRPT